MERLNSLVKRIHISKPLAYIYFVLVITVFLASCSAPSPYVQKEQVKGIYHRIKKGETLRNVARAYNVKLQDLAEANNIRNPDLIQEGSVLFIPDAHQVIDDVMTSAKKMETDTKVATTADSAAEVSKGSDKKTLPSALTPEKTKTAKVTPGEDTMAETAPLRKPASEKVERKTKGKSAPEEKEEIQFEKKRFIWPVQGSVKTRFGIQPNKTYHNWIKIVSAAGTQVKAAASGTVIFSSALPTFGETIIIRHADNFATVYAHLKTRHVKSDQSVKKEDVIALLGEIDEAGNAYMNFEVRLQGKARNPLFFLP